MCIATLKLDNLQKKNYPRYVSDFIYKLSSFEKELRKSKWLHEMALINEIVSR